MKPAPFDYVSAETVDEAVAVLAAEGDEARLLAGGQSLIAMLNMRLIKPSTIIDVSRVDGLNKITSTEAGLRVGAATTQRSLLDLPQLEQYYPLLSKALPWVGHFQTRSRGTVCGSIAHADPSSELPLCLALLNGSVELRSDRGHRKLEADAFQTGMLQTACAADEMIESVTFPAADKNSGYAFHEFGYRHGDFAIVAVAAVVDKGRVRIAVGGMTDRPEVREFRRDDTDLDSSGWLDDVLNDLAWTLHGSDDQHATSRYRRDLVRGLGRQAVKEADACRV